DFGREEGVDQVQILTSQSDTKKLPQIEAMISGQWQKIAATTEQNDVPAPAQIRRMATYEMHARGIDYLLMHDSAYGADAFPGVPEGWVLKLIAKGAGVRLYKTIW